MRARLIATCVSTGNDTPAEVLQKIIYHAGRANIREVWVANRRVHSLETRPPIVVKPGTRFTRSDQRRIAG